MELVRQKNVATIITFPIIDADGDIITGAAALDSEIDTWTDAAAPDGFVDCTNEATEVGATGIYYLSLTQAEMNADYIYIQVKTSTAGAKTQHILIRTMVGDPLNVATTDDGGTINVTGGAIDTVTTTTTATAVTTVNGIANNVITAAAIADGAIDAATFAANAITAAAIADGAIDAATFAAGAINAAAIANAAIDNATFAADVGTTAYATNNIALAADKALVQQRLDHLVAVADADDVVNDAIIAKLASKAAVNADWSTFVSTTDSLEAMRDRGDAAWITATGFSTHSAADVWAVAVRQLTGTQAFNLTGNITGNLSGSVGSVTGAVTVGTNNDKTNYSIADATSDAVIADAVWNAATVTYGGAGSYGLLIETDLDATISSRSSHTAAAVAALILVTPAQKIVTDASGFVTANLNGDLTATMKTSVGDAVWDEVLAAHTTLDTAGLVLNMLTQDTVTLSTDVALGSIIGQMLDDGTAWSYNRATDSLEVLGAATAPSAATIADAVWDELIAGHLGAGSTGAALNAAGSAGDPWATLIPGAYGAGTAGNILGNSLTGHIPQTGNCYTRLGAPVGASISADIALVQADTDNMQTRLPAALVGGRMDSSVGAMAAGVVTAAAIATGAVDADALAADAVDEIWNEAMDAHGSTARNILKSLFAIPEGKIIQDSDAGTFTYYEQDDVTPEFMQTYLGLTRTVA